MPGLEKTLETAFLIIRRALSTRMRSDFSARSPWALNFDVWLPRAVATPVMERRVFFC